MGVDYHVYFGPYVVVDNPLKTITEPRRTCANDKCSRFRKELRDSKVQFCPTCGEKIRHMPFKKEVQTHNMWDFTEEIKERWSRALQHNSMPDGYENKEILIPNVNFGIKRQLHFDVYGGDCPSIVYVSPGERGKEVIAFMTSFEKEIQKAEETFGKPLTIEWGLLIYSS